jgi:uncharacterized protein YpiB (UPF0302 family)
MNMNLSKQKVKYICEVNKELNIEEYYKRVYLSELNVWGIKKKISKATFEKRKNEGYQVEYYKATIDFREVKGMIKDIDSLIDLSLQTRDKEWFHQLSKRKNFITNLLK